MDTLVSIILPIHEKNSFFKKAIDSILNQTYENTEIIIVANGCTKEFIRELRNFKLNNAKIKLVETNTKYLPFALNLGINEASGFYIARMDADDICHELRIEKQVEFLQSNPNVSVVGSNVNYIDENDVIFGASNYKINDTQIRKYIYYRTPFAHPTVMIKKKDLESVGGYMYGTYSEDYDLWLRFNRNKDILFANLEDKLVNYRIHNGQATNKKNARNIFSYDFSLKLRELMLDFEFVKVMGLFVTAIDYIYVRFLRKK